MKRETTDVIKEVAMKAKECFAQSDGTLLRTCIGGVWHSGPSLCGRKPTDIGRFFIQECLLLIGAFAVEMDKEDKAASDLLNKAGGKKGILLNPPTFPKVYFSEVRDHFEKSIDCCHNGYCNDEKTGGGVIYERVQRTFDELSTISDKDWNIAIDWLFESPK